MSPHRSAWGLDLQLECGADFPYIGAMTIATRRTIRSGESEAVQLPEAVACGVERPTVAEMIRRLKALPAPAGIEVRDEDVAPNRGG